MSLGERSVAEDSETQVLPAGGKHKAARLEIFEDFHDFGRAGSERFCQRFRSGGDIAGKIDRGGKSGKLMHGRSRG